MGSNASGRGKGGGRSGQGRGRASGGSGHGRAQQSSGGKPSRGPRGTGRPQGGKPQDRDLVEGRNAVGEALSAGVPLKRLFVSDAETDARLARLVSRAEAAGVAIERVPRARLDALSSHGAHQGVMAQAAPFSYAELADVIAAAGEGPALVVVLDHVTDEGNFGAIVRSAEVVGAAGVVIPKARSVSVGPAAYKTSAGAVAHVPVAQVPNLATALDQLKDAGFWAGAATEHAETDVWSAPLKGRVALVMGSEGEGISRLVLEHCDFTCRLPQRGRVESLNVAQAATVMAYEWMRQTFAGGSEADA